MYLTRCDIEMLVRVARHNPGDGTRISHHYMQLVTELTQWAEEQAGTTIGDILRPGTPSIDPDHLRARAQDQKVAQMTLEPMTPEEQGAMVDFRNAKLSETV